MFGTILRVALLRVLPSRLVPLLTAWQVFRMLRERRNRSPEATSTAERRSGSASRRR